MIQRIQSLWLLLVALLAFATIKLPIYSGVSTKGVDYQMLTAVTGGFFIMILTMAIGIIALIAIFLFKNRTIQLRLCLVGIVLELILLYLYWNEISTYTQGTFSLAALLHIAILVFYILALIGINKDEKIIRDSNRLR